MRRTTYFVIALALVLGFTQCKKEQPLDPNQSEGVRITLNVNGGAKVAVDPIGGGTYASVTWENGDVLYVGNNGAYCGYLTYSGSAFSGTITPTSGDNGDYLHFYFMGNKGPVGSAPSSVNISDQTSKYPVISYGRSTSLYNSGTSSYSATLYNKCAIGKFTISGVDTDKAITITGMKNTVAVDFSKNSTGDVVNPYTYSKTGSGEIRLHAESNTVRWAILLPQDEVTTATAYASSYTSTSAFTVPAVSANGYYDTPVTVTMSAGSPVGAFTINANGDQVFFAPGNLQYTKSTSTWSFMEHQWSTVETLNQSVGTNYASQNVVSLFGWGTSGSAPSGQTARAPYYTNAANDDYVSNITTTGVSWGTGSEWDWGTAAASDLGSGWRTLTKDEWVYLFNTRKVNNGQGSGKSYTLGQTVNDVLGVVLYPDDYTGSTYSGSDWSTFESEGCVFLPAAGYRSGPWVYDVGSLGGYWSSTAYSTSNAYYVHFNSGTVIPANNSSRYRGYSVRLVRPV